MDFKTDAFKSKGGDQIYLQIYLTKIKLECVPYCLAR